MRAAPPVRADQARTAWLTPSAKGGRMQPARLPGSGARATGSSQPSRSSVLTLAGAASGLPDCPLITLSNRGSGIHGASCALRAGERLHDLFHENDNSDRL